MRVLYLAIGLAVFSLAAWGLFGAGWEEAWDMERMVASFEEARGWAWAVGILLLVADLVLPLPGTVVMSALGAVYGFWWGGVFAAVGAILSGLLGYGAGRFVREETAVRWLGEKDVAVGKRVIDAGGAWVVAMSRAVPILPEVIACLAGLLRMRFWVFVLALACGSVPMGFLFAWVGVLGRDEPGWAVGFSLLFPALLWGVAVLVKKVWGVGGWR